MATIQQMFPSYGEALAACGKGYDDDEIAGVVARKTAAMVPTLGHAAIDPDPSAVVAMAVGLAARGNTAVRVLDFGGASGYAYFIVNALLGGRIALTWVVVETAAMVRQASSLIRADGLSFVTSVDEAVDRLGGPSSIDLVYAAGAVQCVPEPEDATRTLVGIGAPVLLVARLPLHAGPRCVGVQTSLLSHNGPGPLPDGVVDRAVHYPVTFVDRAVYRRILLQDYDIRGQFLSPSANYVVGTQQAPGVSILLCRSAV